MKVSNFVVESLRSSGIDTVFGLPGVHALGLWDALSASDVRYVGFRHEQAAAHAADGYGRDTGKPGPVFLSTGPGALNALSALAEAFVSSSPVIAIASNIASPFVGKAKGALHEATDLLPAFQTVTRFAGRALKKDEVPDLVRTSLSSAFGPRPGPTYIEIPADVLDEELDADPVIASATMVDAPLDAIKEAAFLLGMAARPIIWAGGGVLRARASAELQRLAEMIGAPVITTFMGKAAIPENHPAAVGMMVRQPEMSDLLNSADLLLSVGSRFSGMATANWQLTLPSQHIQIDIDEQELGKNYPLRLGIHSDARLALEAIIGELEQTSKARSVIRATDSTEESSSINERLSAGASLRKLAIERAHKEGPREMAMLEAVRNAIDPSVVTVHDMTIPSYWAVPFLEITVPGTFHYPYGYASLGFSFPAAIGVAAARKGQPVVCFSGDGGFMYHCRELATVKESDLPVTVIVFNDRAWGVLKSFAQSRYQQTFGLDLPGPDFVAMAESFGVPGNRADEPADLEKALRSAVETGGPHLIEVPGSWGLPPPSEYYRR